MTSYNTGTTFKVTNSGTPSGTGTIPAGVLSGDTIYVFVMCFTTATGTPTLTLSSNETAPSAVGSQQATGAPGGGGSQQVVAGAWKIAAGASDAGATLTFGATGGTGGAYWFNVGLVAYTGAGATDVDAGNHEGAQGQTTGDITTPSLSTGVAGDWQIQAVMGGPPSGFDFSGVPAGLTGRESITHTGNQGLLLYIADSNGSAGGSGTSIGNTAWTGTAVGGATNVMASFTIGLAPAGGTAHTATASLTVTPSFTAQPSHGHYRTAALTVSPSFSAARARGKYRTAALTVTPSFSAARTRGKYRGASLTVTPVFSAVRLHVHGRRASLTVVPSFTAATGAPPRLDPGQLAGAITADLMAGAVTASNYAGVIT